MTNVEDLRFQITYDEWRMPDEIIVLYKDQEIGRGFGFTDDNGTFCLQSDEELDEHLSQSVKETSVPEFQKKVEQYLTVGE